MTYQEKKKIAEWLAIKNRGAVSGSIMLRERGIELGREPDDIDIIVDDHLTAEDLILPPLVTGYENESKDYIVLARCWYNGVKIEFMTDAEAVRRARVLSYRREGASPAYCQVEDLLNAKERYIQEDISWHYVQKCERDVKIIRKWLLKGGKE